LKNQQKPDLTKPRFPFGSSNSTINVPFQWADSMRPKQMCSVPSLSLEKACCIYNIAVLECQKAMNQDRATPEGATAATKSEENVLK
jgi:hypothetical protein